MTKKRSLRACAAQISPVFMDKKASVEKYAETIREAGRQGVDLIVTPETGIPVYPYWRNNFGYTDPQSARLWKETVVRFYDEAVRIPGPETDELGRAVKAAGLTAVIGLNEQDDRPGSRTLYNTMLFIGPDGEILGRHRKLMPTHQERIFWGRGDASDLRVFDTPFGVLGGLICFENHMTLLKAAMAVKGEEVHAACWPGYWAYGGPGNTVRDMSGTHYPLHHSDQDSAVREYAFETQTFVVSASLFMTEADVPDDFPYKKTTNWKWAMGGSAIATPFGTYAAEPLFGKEGLVIADLDLADRIVAKNVFDCMGHYARWDVAQLRLKREGVGPEPGRDDFGPTFGPTFGLGGLRGSWKFPRRGWVPNRKTPDRKTPDRKMRKSARRRTPRRRPSSARSRTTWRNRCSPPSARSSAPGRSPPPAPSSTATTSTNWPARTASRRTR